MARKTQTWSERVADGVRALEEFPSLPGSLLDDAIGDVTHDRRWSPVLGEPDEVHGLYEVALRAAVGSVLLDARRGLEEIFYVCQSPIEQAFLVAFLAYHHRDTALVLRTQGDDGSARKFTLGQGGLATVTADVQARIGDYRVDFLVTYEMHEPPAASASVVVECDGHDFHDRTKQQASADRRRDRHLQALGLPVLRFTGSDIWRSAADCAWDAYVTVGHAAYRKHREADERGGA